MRLPCLLQFRILKEAIKALFTGPYTSKFPFQPHVPHENFRGKPEYQDECVGCGACAEVCPADAIEVIDSVGEKKRRFVLHLDHCIFCGQCHANCITEKGIIQTGEFDLACFSKEDCVEKTEKTLVVCDGCGEIIGCLEHILWLAKKLGPLAYSNPTLFLTYLKDVKLVKELKTAPRPEAEVGRADRFKILCPRCRREVVIRESQG